MMRRKTGLYATPIRTSKISGELSLLKGAGHLYECKVLHTKHHTNTQ